MARLATSLPTPLSPVRSTLASLRAASASSIRSARAAALIPMTLSRGSLTEGHSNLPHRCAKWCPRESENTWTGGIRPCHKGPLAVRPKSDRERTKLKARRAQLMVHGEQGELETIRDAQLGEDPGEVMLHGLRTDLQL